MVNGKKLRELENNILPEQPKEAFIHITDEHEKLLFEKATTIRDRLYPEVSAMMKDETLTYENKIEASKKIYGSITPQEKTILDKDAAFCILRLKDLMLKYFEPQFPQAAKSTVHLRILWFFREMDKLIISESIEDSEYKFNRDEDKPDFDDFAWWDRVENRIKTEFPEGVFTEQSYKNLEHEIDKLYSAHIQQYWIEHPEQKKAFFEALDKEIAEAKAQHD